MFHNMCLATLVACGMHSQHASKNRLNSSWQPSTISASPALLHQQFQASNTEGSYAMSTHKGPSAPPSPVEKSVTCVTVLHQQFSRP